MDNRNLFAVASSKNLNCGSYTYNHNTLHHKLVVEARERKIAIVT